MPSSPVFVASALRSGSTLLALMLDRHPAFRNPGEFDFLFDPIGDEGDAASAERISAEWHVRWLRTNRIFHGMGRAFPEAPTLAQRVRGYIETLREEGGHVLTLNLHRNFCAAHAFYPRARFIHLVRDPRDCARSAMLMGWGGNVHHALDPWLEAEQSWAKLRPRLQPSQVLELHYEALVRQPEVELARLCAFLGEPYVPAMVDLHGTTYEAPSAAYAEQWRRKLSPREWRWVELRAQPWMAALGYAPSGADLTPLRLHERVALRLSNRWGLFRFRSRRYGTRWLSEALWRRLGAEQRADALRLEMNRIDEAHLR